MSKPAKFDRDEVVEKATNLYWQKGFHATSMRNLQDVVDMRPGSIYASFGGKEALFKLSIQHYASRSKQQLDECLEQTGSPIQALKLFMTNTVIGNRTSAPSGICMLVKSISELTEEQPELLAEAKRLLAGAESRFTDVVQTAIDCGELPSDTDAGFLARYIQIQLTGLRIYAKATENDEAVSELIDGIFAGLANVKGHN